MILGYSYTFHNFPKTTDQLYHTGMQVDKEGFVYACERGRSACYRIDPK